MLLDQSIRAKKLGLLGMLHFFRFNGQRSKPVTTGIGGWAIVNNPELRKKTEKIFAEFIEPSYREDLLLRFQYHTYSNVYENRLRGKGIETIKTSNNYEAVFLRYPIIVQDKRKVLNDAKRMRLEIGDWFLSPVHPNLRSLAKTT